jgi:hypothetical protein
MDRNIGTNVAVNVFLWLCLAAMMAVVAVPLTAGQRWEVMQSAPTSAGNENATTTYNSAVEDTPAPLMSSQMSVQEHVRR